ncbi:MAG: biotin-dependent carboxyltransferase family protein [Proteobacteria bacterium]|nr:biotin-dependent carboxyltransferase family protein [Pseudomonadota bacterium]
MGAISTGGGRILAGALSVIDGGFATTVQDAGRRGYRSLGVPLSGALDSVWLGCANSLAGNPPDRPALEMRYTGASLEATRGSVCVGWAGDADVRVVRADGKEQSISGWRSVVLDQGDIFEVGSIRGGVAYLAVSGGIALLPQLGSCSTYARAGIGGIEGRSLRRGDVLPVGDTSATRRGDLMHARGFEHAGGNIRVILGPQEDYFTAAALIDFRSSEYRVTRDLDRMGIRLSGQPLTHQPDKGADIVSDGVTPGAIQVPADGQPILLLADCQTVGGYPKIATVIQADLPRLAHLMPGQAVRFSAVTRQEAWLALRAQRDALSAWISELVACGPAGGVDEAALYNSNLISGMIDAEAA